MSLNDTIRAQNGNSLITRDWTLLNISMTNDPVGAGDPSEAAIPKVQAAYDALPANVAAGITFEKMLPYLKFIRFFLPFGHPGGVVRSANMELSGGTPTPATSMDGLTVIGIGVFLEWQGAPTRDTLLFRLQTGATGADNNLGVELRFDPNRRVFATGLPGAGS